MQKIRPYIFFLTVIVLGTSLVPLGMPIPPDDDTSVDRNAHYEYRFSQVRGGVLRFIMQVANCMYGIRPDDEPGELSKWRCLCNAFKELGDTWEQIRHNNDAALDIESNEGTSGNGDGDNNITGSKPKGD